MYINSQQNCLPVKAPQPKFGRLDINYTPEGTTMAIIDDPTSNDADVYLKRPDSFGLQYIGESDVVGDMTQRLRKGEYTEYFEEDRLPAGRHAGAIRSMTATPLLHNLQNLIPTAQGTVGTVPDRQRACALFKKERGNILATLSTSGINDGGQIRLTEMQTGDSPGVYPKALAFEWKDQQHPGTKS